MDTVLESNPNDSLCSTSRKRKRGSDNYMDDAQWAKIAKLAVDNGVGKAAR